MQFVAQPPGTAAAAALPNRGEDPEFIASNAYDFYASATALVPSVAPARPHARDTPREAANLF